MKNYRELATQTVTAPFVQILNDASQNLEIVEVPAKIMEDSTRKAELDSETFPKIAVFIKESGAHEEISLDMYDATEKADLKTIYMKKMKMNPREDVESSLGSITFAQEYTFREGSLAQGSLSGEKITETDDKLCDCVLRIVDYEIEFD